MCINTDCTFGWWERFVGELLKIIAQMRTGANMVEAVVCKLVFCVGYWFPPLIITNYKSTQTVTVYHIGA